MYSLSIVRLRAICTLVFFFILSPLAFSREITDMTGRKVTVPDTITKVFGSAPPITYLIYAIDPNLLAGLYMPLAKIDQPYLNPVVHQLPVLGGWHGQGRTPNIEMLLNVKPDMTLLWANGYFDLEKHIEALNKVNMPTVSIKIDRLTDHLETLPFLGELLQRQERTQQLAAYIRDTLTSVQNALANLPESERLTVYYAQGVEGLNTDCDQSFHAEVINLAGGRNVYQCAQTDLFGMVATSMEQVMTWNPQVIVAQEKAFYEKVYIDPRWQNIAAVKNHRVYLIPRIPFNWFDRPPSFMRAIGVKWFAHLLYPKIYSVNINQETQQFYKLFLNIDLSEQALQAILNP